MSGPYVDPLGYSLGHVPDPRCSKSRDPITQQPFDEMEDGTDIVVERYGERDDQVRCYDRVAFSHQAQINGTNPVTREPLPSSVKDMVYIDDPLGPPRRPRPLEHFRHEEARRAKAKKQVRTLLGRIRETYMLDGGTPIPYAAALEEWTETSERVRRYAPGVFAAWPPDFDMAVKHSLYNDPGVTHG